MFGVNGWFVFLFFLSVALAAFFCSAETAFISIQKLRLQHLIEGGHPAARRVSRIIERPEKFLATVLFGINFFETAMATLGTIMAVTLWGENLGAAVATIVITIVTVVLAEYIPKSIASRHGVKIALIYARPIEFFAVIFYPVVFILEHIGIRFTGRLGEDGVFKPTISEEEFRTAINVGRREGTVETETAEMLSNVFEIGDHPVREVMVPRPEVIFIEKGSTVADFFKLYEQHPFSRYPVFKENQDNLVGILSIKDVLLAQAKGTISNESVIDDMARPACVTPETKPINELLAEMRDGNFHMCIVVDEYGGTAGIVSFSQLVGEIIGPAGGETAGVEKDYEIIDERTFQIDGGMRVEEANEEMGLGLPEGDYETVAGFILHLLHRIPKQGEQIKYKHLKLVITKMSGVKIEEVLMTKEHADKGTKEPDAAPSG